MRHYGRDTPGYGVGPTTAASWIGCIGHRKRDDENDEGQEEEEGGTREAARQLSIDEGDRAPCAGTRGAVRGGTGPQYSHLISFSRPFRAPGLKGVSGACMDLKPCKMLRRAVCQPGVPLVPTAAGAASGV